MQTVRPLSFQIRRFRRRMAALLLCCLAMQAAPPGRAQEFPQADGDSAAAAAIPEANVEVRGGFRLPASHGNSIYFLPGSAGLTETALACLAAAADRLQANTALHVTVVGYADDLGEAAFGEELRAGRAAAVADELLALGVPPRRIATAAANGEEDAVLPCISEYCRQNYRRAALLFSKSRAR